MKVKLKLKEGINPRVYKNGMWLGPHFVEREEKEFEFSKKDEWFLKCTQFKAYMEKVGRVVKDNDNRIKVSKKTFDEIVDSGVKGMQAD